MPGKTVYERGPDKRVTKSDDDPNDDFSQEAAKNRKPPLGTGLTEKVDAGQKRAAQEDRKAEQAKKPTRDTRETPSPTPDDKAE